jgi:hypothetical protein
MYKVRILLISIVIALYSSLSIAYATSCSDQIGMAKAKILVNQCLQASPATHPPCNVQNSCDLINDEIARGCDLAKTSGGILPGFCLATRQPAANPVNSVVSAPAEVFQNSAFQTPSKNIFCIFSSSMNGAADSMVRCEINQFTPSFDASYSKTRDEDECVGGGCGCEPKRLNRYHLSSKSKFGENFCPTLDLYDPINGDIKQNEIILLNYGTIFQKDGISCISDQKGLTCTNLSGHGFFLSKAKQSIF